jgi:hypothetical protein
LLVGSIAYPAQHVGLGQAPSFPESRNHSFRLSSGGGVLHHQDPFFDQRLML